MAIIGGGVIGLACALNLTRAGRTVTVLDGTATGLAASWNNAGHIATEQVVPLASGAMLRSAWNRRFAAGGALDLPFAHWRSWLPFGLRLLFAARPGRYRRGRDALEALLAEAMPAWQRAAAAMDDPGLVRADGHLIAWESEASARRGMYSWQHADIGTAAVGEATAADRARVAALVGESAAIRGVARFTGSGQIRDLGELAAALERTLIAAGGRIERREARIVLDDGRATVPGFPAGIVLVAAGVGSGPLLRSAGLRVPLVAERGYHIRGGAQDWPADLPPVVFEDRSMIVTRYADTVQASSFVEIAAPDAPPDPRKWVKLEQHVAALGLPIAAPFTRWMGARPTLPDYLPAIGRARRIPNLLYAFGHQHLGLTTAAITGELVAALVAGDRPSVDLSPFDLARFGGR